MSGQKTKYLKKWKYELEMNFLKPYMKERETISSVEAQSDVEKNSSATEDEETFSENETNQSNNIAMESISSPNENITHSIPPAPSGTFCKPQPKKIMTPKKRKKPECRTTSESASSHLMKYIIEKEKEEEVKSNKKTEINVIDQFFQSMSLTVKQFSPYHQHLAKTRVFSVISELELEHLKSQQMHQQQNISEFQSIPQSTQAYTLSPIDHPSDSDTSASIGNFFQTFTQN